MSPDPSSDLASRKIVVLSDPDPDPSAVLGFTSVIAQGFRGPFLINSSWHDFETVDEERKLSSQLWYAGRKRVRLRIAGKFTTTYFFAYDMSNQQWLRIAEYMNYSSSTYVFIFSFVSLTKYAGRKLKTVMWLRMAEKFMSTYFIAYGYLANVSSIDCG